MKINPDIKTPYYLIDETLLLRNLKRIKDIKDRSGCKVLLAQKAFSMYHFYPLMAEYLDGTTASGLFESRLGYEHFGKEVHVYAPAYKDDDFVEIIKYADHIVFNSVTQLMHFKDMALSAGKTLGLRINPEISTQNHGMYDPCSPTSRMGTRLVDFDESILPFISGLHFHTLCQQNADALEITLKVVEEKFGKYLHQLKWINFGGGHHLTRDDYDTDLLVKLIKYYKNTYNLEVYLEPGEGIVLNTGFFVAQVLDIVKNDMPIAILDTSATCHMPDVLEMPFMPPVVGSVQKSDYHYRLAGYTCLTGDNIGEYYFNEPLRIGTHIVFEDMALYTMVKNNTFNGIPLPSIYVRTVSGDDVLIKQFDYLDFKHKLS
ncbi:MAG: carboxynorspermidine decarboxylase [Bacillota bacterium]|nr:MAG: carboxynorspermidine decarboxylase [Bacillota bacterium]